MGLDKGGQRTKGNNPVKSGFQQNNTQAPKYLPGCYFLTEPISIVW